MAKQPNATPVYNAIFQEHSNPGRAITGRNNNNFASYDKGISCHVFAIASPITWDKAQELNSTYSDIGTPKEIQRAQDRIMHEFAEQDKKDLDENYVIQPYPEPEEEVLNAERSENMQEILELRKQQKTVLPVDNLYLCGGFREGKMTPEHMWIEDHSNGITYDTFINRGGIAVVDGVGREGEPFAPGCEGSDFEENEIHRVKVDGYTWGQLIAIASGAEKIGFPKGIENAPQVLAAKIAVNDANIALSKIPEADLTPEESEVLEKVEREQSSKRTQKDIDNVVKSLGAEEKLHYDNALGKLERVANERRRVAREAVGTGPEAFLERVKEQTAQKEKVEEVQNQGPQQPQSTYESLRRIVRNFAIGVGITALAATTAYLAYSSKPFNN
ncbi:hypothetical protein [Legionella sainthelensi]|uniref:Uncharacterized protein n=1 Tax=Legionella sainthelensi TaxID=28087 RepID=A0A2H5FKZ2_9GAMM|nr:hypothetical protein [Legionella sainthelensi]AUH72219.1 hypothetical protein CAB17_09210 [Legionella sainthelensi]